MINLRRATAKRFYYNDRGELYCYLKDGAFNGGLQENNEDLVGQNNIPVLMPPGLTVDFGKDSEVKTDGFVMEYGGRNIFFVMPNILTRENGDKQPVFEDIEGTVLYHLQDNTVRISLNKDKILVQFNEDTSLILEDNKISSKNKESSLVLEGKKISGTAGNSAFVIEDGQPVHLEAGGFSLKEILNDIVDLSKTMMTTGNAVQQNAGPDTITKCEMLSAQKISKFAK